MKKQITSMINKTIQSILLCLLVLTSVNAFAIERVTYYHNDALGSPVAVTDKDGNLLWKEEYQPYGERILREDSGTNDLWYTGKQEEEDFGINYFGARWYDPTIGRFMGIDPAGFSKDSPQSFNRYAYANNNPYLYVDPDGKVPINFAVGLIAATGAAIATSISGGSRGEILAAAGAGFVVGASLGTASTVIATKLAGSGVASLATATAAGELTAGITGSVIGDAAVQQANIASGQQTEFDSSRSLTAVAAGAGVSLPGLIRSATVLGGTAADATVSSLSSASQSLKMIAPTAGEKLATSTASAGIGVGIAVGQRAIKEKKKE